MSNYINCIDIHYIDYPYGFNVDLGHGMIKDSDVMVSREFSPLNRARCWQSKGIKHKTPDKISAKRFVYKLNHKVFTDLPNKWTFLVELLQY